MRDTRTTPRTRGFVIDLGSDVTDGRYIVAKDFAPTASVLDVLEGRSGQVLYRGDDHDEATRIREGYHLSKNLDALATELGDRAYVAQYLESRGMRA